MNKFLPFITKKSSPIYIYDALLSRSKGIDKNTTNSLFYAILKFGIVKVREHAKSLPQMDGTSLYEELVNKFRPERIDERLLAVFIKMSANLQEQEEKWSSELNKFDIKDIMCFFLVMSLLDKEKEETELNFHELLKYEEILNNLPKYINLSNDGTGVVFNSVDKLENFILYMAVFEKTDTNSFNVSLKEIEKTEGNEDDTPF